MTACQGTPPHCNPRQSDPPTPSVQTTKPVLGECWSLTLSRLGLMAAWEGSNPPCLMMLALAEAMTVTSRHKSVHPCKGDQQVSWASVKSWQEQILYDISSNKCWDPCSAVSCDADSSCEVTSHRAVCRDPCTPSPCGPFSQCSSRSTERCSCLPGHLGHPPHCRPECSGDTECPGYLACVR